MGSRDNIVDRKMKQRINIYGQRQGLASLRKEKQNFHFFSSLISDRILVWLSSSNNYLFFKDQLKNVVIYIRPTINNDTNPHTKFQSFLSGQEVEFILKRGRERNIQINTSINHKRGFKRNAVTNTVMSDILRAVRCFIHLILCLWSNFNRHNIEIGGLPWWL